MTDPMQTLDAEQRQRMDELIQLLGTRSGEVSGPAVHGKLADLAELQLLLAVHNANGIDQIRVLMIGELDHQQDVARQDRARIMKVQEDLLALAQRQQQQLDRQEAENVALRRWAQGLVRRTFVISLLVPAVMILLIVIAVAYGF